MSFVGKIVAAPFRIVWFLIRLAFMPIRLALWMVRSLLRFISHNLPGAIIGGLLGYAIGKTITESERKDDRPTAAQPESDQSSAPPSS